MRSTTAARDFATTQFPQHRLDPGEWARGYLAMDAPGCSHRQNLAQIFARAHARKP